MEAEILEVLTLLLQQVQLFKDQIVLYWEIILLAFKVGLSIYLAVLLRKWLSGLLTGL